MTIGAVLLVLFLGTLPVAGRIVAVIPAFLAFTQALIFGAMLLSAAMLLAEFRLHRQTGIAILAGMYLFASVLAIASLLYVPQVLPWISPAFASVSPWLYTLRHLAIAIFAIAYALALRNFDGVTIPSLPRLSTWTIVAASVAAAIGATAAVAMGIGHLPSLAGPDALRIFVTGPYLAGMPLFLIALFLIARQRYPTRLMLWVALALWAFFLDFAAHAVNVDRYTVEYYLTRLIEVVGSSCVLGYLIYFGLESYRTATDEATTITARRSEERRRFAATVNSAAIGIAHLDVEGRLLFMNDQLVRMLAGAAGATDATFWDLIGVEPRPLPAPGEAPLAFETAEDRSGGRSSSLSMTICAPRKTPSQAPYWIAFVHDITSHKQAEETVRQMNEIKSTFITTVTHEIRTPLSGIVGVSELLRRTPMTERQRSFSEALDSSANTLLRLVNDVLDFSKIESTQVEFDRTLFDLSHLIEAVTETFAPEAARRGLKLSASVAPELAGGFYGDPVRLRQILTNLVGNALKFTERGEVRILADALDERDGRATVTLRVIDTGIGIPPEVREEIFDPFTQAERATSRRFGGTGLGLAIVRRLLEQMGGQIAVTSEEGQGSIFTCTLQIERDAEGRRLDRRSTSLRGLRCAIVSPEAEIRELVHSMTISWGMHAFASDSEATAEPELRRAAAAGTIPNCVIVDGNLPGASALVESLCSEQQYDDLQFVFLGSLPESASHQISTWRRRLIRRPPTASALYDAIAQLCVSRASERGAEDERVALAPLRPERILIAEDNETNRMLALAQLEELGFGADCVEDGAAAVAAVKTGLFSLILMDCQMPEMDGFEATRAIRRGEAGEAERIPVIAMTANTSAGYREQCLEAGMNDYVAKPVLLTSLQGVLDRWLSRSNHAAPPSRTASDTAPGARFSRLHGIFKGDSTAIFKMLDSALRTFDEMIEGLSSALETRDAAAAAKSAHRIAGVALDIEAEAVAPLAREIERVASEAPGWERLAALFDQLDAAVEEFRLEVARYAETA